MSEPRRPDIGVAWTLIVGFLFFFLLGYYADKRWGTGYKWTLIGLVVGIALFVYELWKTIRNSK